MVRSRFLTPRPAARRFNPGAQAITYRAPVSLSPITLGESRGILVLMCLTILFSCFQSVALPDVLFCLLFDLFEGSDLLLGDRQVERAAVRYPLFEGFDGNNSIYRRNFVHGFGEASQIFTKIFGRPLFQRHQVKRIFLRGSAGHKMVIELSREL